MKIKFNGKTVIIPESEVCEYLKVQLLKAVFKEKQKQKQKMLARVKVKYDKEKRKIKRQINKIAGVL